MTLEKAKAAASEIFPDVRPCDRDCFSLGLTEVGRREGELQGNFFSVLAAMTPSGFPLPELLLFGFDVLLDMEVHGPFEKVRWDIPIEFQGTYFGFQLRKFGLRALCQPEYLDRRELEQFVGKSRALASLAEKYLRKTVAPMQLRRNCITMPNHYPNLRSRYHFLRLAALDAYAQAPPDPKQKTVGGTQYYEHDFDKPQREGGWLATAAIDAYFSALEHLFCVALAFSQKSIPEEGVPSFLSSGWRHKACTILDLSIPNVKVMYDRLVQIREEWRNPIAHGALSGGGGNLYFHLPRVGALPARLTRTSRGAQLQFNIRSRTFAEVIDIFDDTDKMLKKDILRYPTLWAEDGLNVSFDDSNRENYQRAMQSEETFMQFIEGTNLWIDHHANMDY